MRYEGRIYFQSDVATRAADLTQTLRGALPGSVVTAEKTSELSGLEVVTISAPVTDEQRYWYAVHMVRECAEAVRTSHVLPVRHELVRQD